MIPLTHKIKQEIELNGVTYPLDLSYNNVLSVFEVLEDTELTSVQSIETALFLLLGEGFELSMGEREELLKKVFKEYIGDQTQFIETDLKGNPMPVKDEEPAYSFWYDGAYIYAAFMQSYGIDLIEQQGVMSWSSFKALFGGLSEDTVFRKIVSIRTRELPTGKGAEEERKELTKLKRMYALPNTERGD